jgi:hypothetical protein
MIKHSLITNRLGINSAAYGAQSWALIDDSLSHFNPLVESSLESYRVLKATITIVVMSRPTNEPLGDAKVRPSTTKDVNIKDSPRRYGKRPKKLHLPITSTARELRQLVKHQDQLLRLMRESLKLQNPFTGEGVELRPHCLDLDDPDIDELADNEKFAKSFHVDVTLDGVAVKEIMEETVNLFFNSFSSRRIGMLFNQFREYSTSDLLQNVVATVSCGKCLNIGIT